MGRGQYGGHAYQGYPKRGPKETERGTIGCASAVSRVIPARAAQFAVRTHGVVQRLSGSGLIILASRTPHFFRRNKPAPIPADHCASSFPPHLRSLERRGDSSRNDDVFVSLRGVDDSTHHNGSEARTEAKQPGTHRVSKGNGTQPLRVVERRRPTRTVPSPRVEFRRGDTTPKRFGESGRARSHRTATLRRSVSITLRPILEARKARRFND